MNVDNILQSDLINNAAVAKRLFPDSKVARQRLHQKINKQNGQRLTFSEKEQIKSFIKELLR